MIYLLKSDDTLPRVDMSLLHNVCILQLLSIQILPFSLTKEQIESTHYILLTSKNTIKAIMQHEYADLLLQKEAIVIGEQTKAMWIREGGEIFFCPKVACNGLDLAKQIQDSIKGKHILYIGGKDKASNMVEILQESCIVTSVIAYKSYEKSNILHQEFADESIFIFGSPKHYKIFVKHYNWNPTWFAISLGDTTFMSFADDIRKLNAKGDFAKALKVAQAMRNDTPMQNNALPKDSAYKAK